MRVSLKASKVVGYVRVSTEDQDLDAQRTAIAQVAAQRGYELVEVCEDVISSRQSNRPGLERAKGIVASGEADAVIVAKLDRISRSVFEFLGIAQAVPLVLCDLDIDTTTPSGKLMLTILAGFAEFERDMISTRTKEALAERKRQGVKLGRRVTISDDVLRLMRRLRSEGRTYEGIAAELNARMHPGWTPGAEDLAAFGPSVGPETFRTPRGGSEWRKGVVRAALSLAGES